METSTRHSVRPTEAKNPRILLQASSLHHIPWCETYERMISGMIEGHNDPVLKDALLRARKLQYNFNNAPIPDNVPYETLLKGSQDKLFQILGRVGARPTIVRPFTFSYGCNISVGNDFFANHNFMALDASLITIGNKVMIGPNVTIITQTHNVAAGSRCMFALPVTIEDDCWIGAGSTILPGVTLGKGCNIGAGAVVARNVPAATLAVGVPAKVIRKLTEDGEHVEEIKDEAQDDGAGEGTAGSRGVDEYVSVTGET